MNSISIAQIIADAVVFFELVDDETLDPRICVKQMELLGYRLENLERTFLRELVDAFPVVAAGYEGRAAEVVRDIPYYFFLEEELAADDPVELARLEAIRDARED